MKIMMNTLRALLLLVLFTSIIGDGHAAKTDYLIEETMKDEEIDQLLADAKKKGTSLRIALYPGSFDPFHIGHLEACVQSLPYVDYVIVAPNNPNNGKPFRADLKDRYHMIQLSKKEYPQIIATQESINSLNERLFKEAAVIGLLGSDQYGNLVNANKKPKMKAHEWIIIPREGYDVELKDDWNKPIQLLSKDLFRNQNWSSTYIRNKLLKKDYFDLPLVNKEVETFLGKDRRILSISMER